MSDPESTDDHLAKHRNAEVQRLIGLCQSAYQLGQADTLQKGLTDLFELTRQDIERQSVRWLKMFPQRNESGDRSFRTAVEQLARSVFLEVIEAILVVTLDPDRNAYGLVMRIVRRALYDQQPPRRRKIQQNDDPKIGSGDPQASMAPTASTQRHVADFDDEGALRDIPDPAPDFTEHVLERERLQRYWPAVQTFLDKMSAIDRFIFDQRWVSEEPQPFAKIAQNLGMGWTMEAVKQRNYRLLRQLRAYIGREHGEHEGDW
ncbi:MAG: sigma-70 family RNA polymerase sigma factor [Kouleothrix sp.]|jgi:DNA-directed RNA polymerase specialized sigma24 family protein|nr:sigma-70 family RNA polymerase sigma factor [Kouleothrix sp.]